MRGAPAEAAARERDERGAPAEVAASDREGRETPKSEKGREEDSESWGLEQVVGVRGGVPTLLAPWVRGVCDGGDGGGKTNRSSPSWGLVWGESASGHLHGAPSHLPPLGT